MTPAQPDYRTSQVGPALRSLALTLALLGPGKLLAVPTVLYDEATSGDLLDVPGTEAQGEDAPFFAIDTPGQYVWRGQSLLEFGGSVGLEFDIDSIWISVSPELRASAVTLALVEFNALNVMDGGLRALSLEQEAVTLLARFDTTAPAMLTAPSAGLNALGKPSDIMLVGLEPSCTSFCRVSATWELTLAVEATLTSVPIPAPALVLGSACLLAAALRSGRLSA